jgi:hypothetical protein
MKRALALVLLATALFGPAAQGGHEIPVYPSYYPSVIEIRTTEPADAIGKLGKGELLAWAGKEPPHSGALPVNVGTVETLGAILLIRLNPHSPLVRQDACAVAARAMRAATADAIFHPYPVTPFDGDYLHFIDRAEAAKAHWLKRAETAAAEPRLARAGDADSDEDSWDARVESVDAGAFVDAAMVAMNGWVGPPWLRSGWFRAYRLLAGGLEGDARKEADTIATELENADFDTLGERVALERQLVTMLGQGCDLAVAGYTLAHRYYNGEYYAGIENIGYDAVQGFASPMFLRTAKLKDYPWNGALLIGVDEKPQEAWNPVAGFSGPFGRMLWAALSDPALLPAPDDAAWTANRISDVLSVGK